MPPGRDSWKIEGLETTASANSYLRRFDSLAVIGEGSSPVVWPRRVSFVFLVLMAFSAPHSIAATQISWLTGIFVWLISLAVARLKEGPDKHPIEDRGYKKLKYALWAFFAWSVISSLMSYEPGVSLDRLRGVSLFLIVFYVAGNVRSLRAASFLALVLVFSTMINVVWTPTERLIGRGVEIHGLAPDGPLSKALLWEGDALLFANKTKLSTPEDLVGEVERTGSAQVTFYRPDFEFAVTVKKEDLLPGASALEKLGVSGWKKSHNWRSKGFYSHYVFYAEMLQMVASLALGLLVALVFRRRENGKVGEWESDRVSRTFWSRLLHFSLSHVLALCLALMCVALFLTVTRASQGAFVISALLIFAFGAGRKWFLAALAALVPVAAAALWFLQRSREVGFFDASDDSTKYRMTMWRDGIRLWTESPRHLVFGVGMDSIIRRWRQWDLYDRGFLPMGHFHSMVVQLLVERGLPALLLWISVIVIYFSILVAAIRNWRIENVNDRHGILGLGIVLGCFGGAVGFCVSGLVQYNLGSQVTAMLFYFLMGLGVRTAILRAETRP